MKCLMLLRKHYLLMLRYALLLFPISNLQPKIKIKLKKDQNHFKSIEIEKNKDIVEYLSKTNKYRPKLVVGFSAETENVEKNSISKMQKKNCDLNCCK